MNLQMLAFFNTQQMMTLFSFRVWKNRGIVICCFHLVWNGNIGTKKASLR